MEMIVIFNAGRDAAKAGMPRIAPDAILHPRSGLPVKFDVVYEREWLRGYDRQGQRPLYRFTK